MTDVHGLDWTKRGKRTVKPHRKIERAGKMSPTEVVIPEFVPPKEMSVAEILKAAVERSAASNIDLKGLLENADVVEGRPLTDKASLIELPHIITTVAFRKGTKDKDGIQHDYVSCEYTSITDHPIEGVYNDGSTGIRRQIVSYLAYKGVIGKEYQETPDAPIWVNDDVADPEFVIRFIAPRGLRVSEYEGDFGEAKTFYLA